ncbi:MAG: 2,5-diamino-6-(ribosylamino)-4(3H)-pyrimidinone 5'-phosphate reductase [Desulfurococcaceae archaeon TW002]
MRKPYVRVYATMSIDGKIASKTGDSRLSCPYDKLRLHSMRSIVDGVMVGANTIIRDDPQLTVRLVEGRNPVRIVIDGSLKIPLNARVLDVSAAPTIIVTSPLAESWKVEQLRRLGVDVVIVESKSTQVDMSKALEILYEKGLKDLLVEGGGTLLWSLVSQKLINEFRITISPYVIGGKNSISLVEGEGFGSMSEWLKLKLINHKICRCGNEIHLVYIVED